MVGSRATPFRRGYCRQPVPKLQQRCHGDLTVGDQALRSLTASRDPAGPTAETIAGARTIASVFDDRALSVRRGLQSFPVVCIMHRADGACATQ